jgi:HEAT repeat protein
MADVTGNGQPAESPGLPPVVPPSGRFIAQLFVVPGLIVAGAIIAILGFSWLSGFGQPGDKKKYIENLTSTNTDIRWRTAADLAQVLRRDDQLASDPAFGLRLVELLKQALADLEVAEKKMATASDEPRAGATPADNIMSKAREAILKQRSYVQYLCNCAGNLRVPVSADALADLARKPRVSDPKTSALLRRQAVWALAALGDHCRHFHDLPEDRQKEILDRLDAETDSAARRAADSLRGRGTPGAVEALLTASESDDPFLRKLSAHALTFWDGPPAETRRIEDALVRLAHDDGHGTSIEIGKDD